MKLFKLFIPKMSKHLEKIQKVSTVCTGDYVNAVETWTVEWPCPKYKYGDFDPAYLNADIKQKAFLCFKDARIFADALKESFYFIEANDIAESIKLSRRS